ncbi:MAG: HAMP domain-containing sensor histidine kinase [Pseudomonadota bacterium]
MLYFNDSLRALSALAEGDLSPALRACVYRQIVDLFLCRRASVRHPHQRRKALDLLVRMRSSVPVHVRQHVLKTVAAVRHAAVDYLIVLFDDEESAIEPLVAGLRLDDDQWQALLPELSEPHRAALHARGDISPHLFPSFGEDFMFAPAAEADLSQQSTNATHATDDSEIEEESKPQAVIDLSGFDEFVSRREDIDDLRPDFDGDGETSESVLPALTEDASADTHEDDIKVSASKGHEVRDLLEKLETFRQNRADRAKDSERIIDLFGPQAIAASEASVNALPKDEIRSVGSARPDDEVSASWNTPSLASRSGLFTSGNDGPHLKLVSDTTGSYVEPPKRFECETSHAIADETISLSTDEGLTGERDDTFVSGETSALPLNSPPEGSPETSDFPPQNGDGIAPSGSSGRGSPAEDPFSPPNLKNGNGPGDDVFGGEWETDRFGCLRSISPELARVWRLAPSKAIGQSLVALILEEQQRDRMNTALDRRSPFRLLPITIADRSQRLSAVPVFDLPTGRFQGFRGTTQSESTFQRLGDIQPHWHTKGFLPDPKAASAADEAQAAATGWLSDELAKTSTDELSAVAHESLTPLNAIGGFAEMIDNQVLGPVSPAYRARAKRIHSAAQAIETLLNDILFLAKLEDGSYPLGEVALEWGDLIDVAVLETEKTNEISIIHRALGPVEAATVIGDPEGLKRVLTTLLLEAIRFGHPGAPIALTYQVLDDEMAGVRIPLPLWDKAFQFDRLVAHVPARGLQSGETARRRAALVLAETLIKEMGGRIFLRRDPNARRGAWQTEVAELVVGLPRATPSSKVAGRSRS